MSSISTATRVLQVAAKQIGAREGRDSNGNWNNRISFNTWYAQHPLIKNSAFLTTAWCAVFVSWVAAQVGIVGTLIPMHAWTPAGLAWFTKRGQVTRGSGAKPGDVVYFYRKDMGRVAHVGFVESVSGGYITTIEGNTNTSGSRQGNGVYRLKRRIDNNMYFAHPKYGTTPVPPKPSIPGKPTTPVRTGRVVSLAGLLNAVHQDLKKKDETTTNWAAVQPVEDALVAEGLLDKKYSDGHFGDSARSAYGAWQKRLKYTGSDADGIPGLDSLTKLGAKYGFTVTK